MGTFLGMPLFGANYQPWVVMILPPGGFLTLGGILLFLAWRTAKKEDRMLSDQNPETKKEAA